MILGLLDNKFEKVRFIANSIVQSHLEKFSYSAANKHSKVPESPFTAIVESP
jgi:hypothetical protein